mmetsp:Transcript_10676/g.18296  ORF Transcript_10676/g.18296 Transcript_10676/m.18296 type:complete len:575 (+) Transcript_10676:385-2109(+)
MQSQVQVNMAEKPNLSQSQISAESPSSAEVEPTPVASEVHVPVPAHQKNAVAAACTSYFVHIGESIKSQWKFWIVNLLLMALSYGVLVVLLGNDALPGASLFALLLCWACAIILGVVFHVLRLPALLGWLLAGMILRNVPGNILEGLKSSWMGVIRAIAISLVLTRSGFALNFKALFYYEWVGVRTAIIPVIVIGCLVGCIAVPLMGYPWALAIACGFILASTAPAIVVVETFLLESKKNLGKKKGIATLIAIIATLNMVTAISGYNLASSIAFDRGSLAWSILFGPVNIIVGLAAGLAGVLLWFPGVVPNPTYLVVFFFLLNMGIVLLFQHFQWTGAAAIYAFTISIVTRYGWDHAYIVTFVNRYIPSIASWPLFDVSPVPETLKTASRVAAFMWDYIIAPALFSTIGTVLDFHEGDSAVYGKAVVLVLSSWVICVVVAYLMLCRSGLTFLEKAFIAMILPAKATVQAALGGLPLAFFEESGNAEQQAWGKSIQIIAALGILITTPIAVILIRVLGPRWLSDDELTDEDDDVHDFNAHDENQRRSCSIRHEDATLDPIDSKEKSGKLTVEDKV